MMLAGADLRIRLLNFRFRSINKKLFFIVIFELESYIYKQKIPYICIETCNMPHLLLNYEKC